MPFSSQISLSDFKQWSGTTLIPPSPWIGSIIIAAVLELIAFFNSSWSPNDSNLKPLTSVLKLSSLLLPPAANDPIVLPWKDPLKVIISFLVFDFWVLK